MQPRIERVARTEPGGDALRRGFASMSTPSNYGNVVQTLNYILSDVFLACAPETA